jgi:hypothetical protein
MKVAYLRMELDALRYATILTPDRDPEWDSLPAKAGNGGNGTSGVRELGG